MTFESLKKVKLPYITFENGKILSTLLALLILISAVKYLLGCCCASCL